MHQRPPNEIRSKEKWCITIQNFIAINYGIHKTPTWAPWMRDAIQILLFNYFTPLHSANLHVVQRLHGGLVSQQQTIGMVRRPHAPGCEAPSKHSVFVSAFYGDFAEFGF